MDPIARTIWTVGHSTLTMEKFLEMLSAHAIIIIVDVRSIPRSRRSPWFSGDNLAGALHKAGIHYIWMPALGGVPASPEGFGQYRLERSFVPWVR